MVPPHMQNVGVTQVPSGITQLKMVNSWVDGSGAEVRRIPIPFGVGV